MLMKRSRRELIDMVISRLMFKNYHVTLFPCLTFIPRKGMGMPEEGFFHPANLSSYKYLLSILENIWKTNKVLQDKVFFKYLWCLSRTFFFLLG